MAQVEAVPFYRLQLAASTKTCRFHRFHYHIPGLSPLPALPLANAMVARQLETKKNAHTETGSHPLVQQMRKTVKYIAYNYVGCILSLQTGVGCYRSRGFVEYVKRLSFKSDYFTVKF